MYPAPCQGLQRRTGIPEYSWVLLGLGITVGFGSFSLEIRVKGLGISSFIEHLFRVQGVSDEGLGFFF